MPKREQTFSWMNPKLEVRNIKKYGKGVFTKNNIKKEELLCIFGGHVMTYKEELSLPDFRDEAVQISDNFVLGIRKETELEDASYFNHSCNPNSGFHGQIFLIAMRNIKKKEEIVFDYAMVLHKAKGLKPYKMKCGCGQSNCRKIITSSDWKQKELQEKYNGYFSWYLQEKIDKFTKRN